MAASSIARPPVRHGGLRGAAARLCLFGLIGPHELGRATAVTFSEVSIAIGHWQSLLTAHRGRKRASAVCPCPGKDRDWLARNGLRQYRALRNARRSGPRARRTH